MKAKFFYLSIALFFILNILTLPCLALDNKNQIQLNEKQKTQYEALKKTSPNFRGSVNKKFSIPNFLYGKPLFKDKKIQDKKEIISSFFKKYSDLFPININDFEINVENPENRNVTFVHLFQRYKNIPVFGSEMIFTINQNNELIGYLGKIVPNINNNVKPKIKLSAVNKIVAQDLKIDSIDIKPKLFIFNKGILNNISNDNETKLAWRLATNGWVYFIDANNGEIIQKYQDKNNILNRQIYTALGTTVVLPGALIISEGDDTSAITDTDALNAYAYSADVYNYYFNNFSLDSYDNTGSVMISTVDYDLATYHGYNVGAQWCNYKKDDDYSLCPSTQQIIFQNEYVSLDVAAHEWTHAVDDYAVRDEDADLYGLSIPGESGALNESYSDIFAVLIENEYSELDWNIGEDLPGGIIRSLQDPTLYSQPDKYSNYISGGDSHTNSGIPNKAAYLIMREKSEGYENFNGIDVRGLGKEKAENIFYYTLRDQLLTSSTIVDNFNALTLTCLTLDTVELNNLDCESIYDAYTAIEVADGTITYKNAAISTDVESGYAPLTINFDGSDSVSYGRNITDYSWNFGDGAIASGMTASHTYTSAGTYTVTLAIIDSDDGTVSTTQDITVTNPLNTSFTISGDGVTAPATVSFDASATTDATGTITDYSWNFGDGSTSSSGTTATTTHEYTAGGYYNVILTVTDSNGYSDIYNKSVFIGAIGPTYVSGTIYNDTWTAARSPYVINGSIIVASGGTLTIEPGTIIKFYNRDSYLGVEGSLNAAGTSADKIVFTSFKDDSYGGDTNGDGSATSPAAGDWYRLYFASGSIGNIDNTIIQNGNYHYSSISSNQGMISIASDNVTITNSTISNSNYGSYYSDSSIFIENTSPSLISNSILNNFKGIDGSYSSATISNNTFDSNFYGVYLSSGTPIISDNIFTNNTYPIYIPYVLSSGGTTFSNNSGSNNNYNAIYINTITVDGNVYLSNDSNLPYLINNLTINSGNALEIEPGTVIKFVNSSSYIEVDGTLNAQGTSADKIIFTSLKDDTYGGDTNNDGSATTPGFEDWKYINFTNGSSGILDNTVIRQGGYSLGNVYINSNDVSITNSTISNLSSPTGDYGGISVNNASPSITGNTILNNYIGIKIFGSSSSPNISNNTITTNDYSGIEVADGSPSIIQNEIYDNSEIGLIVRGSSTVSQNNIYDNRIGISASGNASIYMNEIYNNISDGAQTSGTVSVYENNIYNNGSYGVQTGETVSIYQNNIYSNSTGIFSSSGTPAISQNSIYNNTSYGIRLYSRSLPNITENDIYNNSSYGLYNSYSTTVTAENNWWGNSTGPYNATSNPSGTGNAVSNYVDFDPWLSTSISAPSDVTSLGLRTDVWQRNITLRWINPADSDFSSVKIDRFDGTAATTIATGLTASSYPDVGLAYNIPYTYTVYAVDADGNQSAGATIAKIIQNPAPRAFTATAGDSQISLSWRISSAPAYQVGGYKVYYRVRGVGSYTALDVGNITSYTIAGLTNGTSYQVYGTTYSTTGAESPRSAVRIAVPRP